MIFEIALATLLASLGADIFVFEDNPALPIALLIGEWESYFRTRFPDPKKWHALLLQMARWVTESETLEDLKHRLEKFHEVQVPINHVRQEFILKRKLKENSLPHPHEEAYLYPASEQILFKILSSSLEERKNHAPITRYALDIPVFDSAVRNGSRPAVIVTDHRRNTYSLDWGSSVDLYSWMQFRSYDTTIIWSWDKDRILIEDEEVHYPEIRFLILKRPPVDPSVFKS